jgi:hypothetical protein
MNVLLMVPLTCFLSEHPNILDVGLGYLAKAIRKHGGNSVRVLDLRSYTPKSHDTGRKTARAVQSGI